MINWLTLGLNDHWKRTTCEIRAFTVSHMDCFTPGCSKAVLLEQFGPRSEASETYVDIQDSAITCHSGSCIPLWAPEQGKETGDLGHN